VPDQNAFTIPTLAERTVPPTPSLLTAPAVPAFSRWGWITGSRKARIALGSIGSILLVRFLPHLGFSTGDVTELTAAISVIGGIWMHSIAVEDANKPKPLDPVALQLEEPAP
jgi:hypothetical protein